MTVQKAKVAIAGAGVYGATTAIRLAEQGHEVHLFDPLGVLNAASAINQFRIHSGYHYPRSPETIRETMEVRQEFMDTYAPAIVRNSQHYYAIPREGLADAAGRVRACHGGAQDFGQALPSGVDELRFHRQVLRGRRADLRSRNPA